VKTEAIDEPVGRCGANGRQVFEATCDADLVIVGRVDSTSPFQHPNGRRILTAHEVVVTETVRSKDPKLPAGARALRPSERPDARRRPRGHDRPRLVPAARDR
jgi:hypothetical protein